MYYTVVQLTLDILNGHARINTIGLGYNTSRYNVYTNLFRLDCETSSYKLY